MRAILNVYNRLSTSLRSSTCTLFNVVLQRCQLDLRLTRAYNATPFNQLRDTHSLVPHLYLPSAPYTLSEQSDRGLTEPCPCIAYVKAPNGSLDLHNSPNPLLV